MMAGTPKDPISRLTRLAAPLVHGGNGPALRLALARRMLRWPVTLALARATLMRRVPTRPHDRVAVEFFLEIARRAYADNRPRVVWTSVFFPSELLWGLGFVPFHPEIVSAIGAGLGLSNLSVTRATEMGYAVDLCTVHRNAMGLNAAGFYPRADAYFAASNLCDVAGQVLANLAYWQRKPFALLDVPASSTDDSVDYVRQQAVINALSAHADRAEILRWLSGFHRPPHTIFIVHGEPKASHALQERITQELGWETVVPNQQETFSLE